MGLVGGVEVCVSWMLMCLCVALSLGYAVVSTSRYGNLAFL